MKTSLRKLPFGCALTFVCFFAAGQASSQTTPPAANRITQVPDNSARITLKGGVHPLARAEFSRGAVADSLTINRILLLLKRSDQQEAALQSLLESQQDKSSANYHNWLSPEDFGKQFGPSDADLQFVTDWLISQGFHDVRVAAGRIVIEFSGSAAQVREAFATQIQNYAVNNAMYVANSSDPQIPAALAPAISGIVSLHNFPKTFHSRFLGDVRKDPGSRKLQPLFTFPDPSSGATLYGVGPGDFATIYNSKTLVNGGNDGTGQTIAIVGETQIDATDVGDFRNMFGLTNNFSSSNIILNGMDPGITSPDEESESDLDVQWSGAVAPGATVKFVVSASTPASAGIDLSALYIIEHNLADVMSESYGACESDLGTAGNAFYNSLWEQAAAQGITVVVSSGDGGSAGCDDFNNQDVATHGLAVSGLAGTPFNVSVGGTDFNQINVWSTYWNSTNDSTTGTSAKSYIPEVPWSDNCAQLGLTGCGSTAPDWSHNIVAGSGGPSKVYGKPKWQMGVNGVPNDNHRDQPDISLFASPGFTGSAYLFCQKDLTGISTCNLNSPFYTFHAIGGTSASAPAFAGVMALVNQYSAAHGGSSRQGNPNPVLYALSKKSGASCTSSATEAAGCIFNDVTSGNSYLATHYGKSVGTNSVPCKGGTPNCSSAAASANGVLVDPSHTTTEAWTAAAGYDMATGLGSLNVNNLAANWGSVSAIGTTTTLSLSPTTGITHGTNENVSVTVNVTPKSGTAVPAGDVSLIATLADGSTLGLDQFTLSNGNISGVKTQSLPGGTYKVYAHYAGDGTNAASDSTPVQVTVGKESSQTFIVIPSFDAQGNQTSGNTNSVVYGSNYIIRMYVSNSSAVASTTGPPSPTCEKVNEVTCPSGTVTLTGNGSPVDGGTYTLNNIGYTRDIAPTLTGGTYSLVAKYSGDDSYTASTSATDTFTVTPATMQLTLTVPNSALIGVPFSFGMSGTTSAVGASPIGTLTVYDGLTPIFTISGAGLGGYGGNHSGSGSTAGFGIDSSLTLSTFGPHSLTLTYTGDANYSAAATSPQIVHAVYPTSMTVQSSATTLTYGATVTLTATLTTSRTSPLATGQIAFKSLTGQTTVVTGPTIQTLTNGFVSLQATATAVMQVGDLFEADYSGDTSYESASGDTTYITVSNPDFSMVASQPGLLVTAGQSASLSITIAPATPMTASLQFQLSPPSPAVNCSVSPTQIQLTGASSVTALVTCSVPAPSSSSTAQLFPLASPKLYPGTGWWKLSGLFAAAALLVLLLPARPRVRPQLAYALLLLSTFSFLLGCGGGGGSEVGGGGGVAPTNITLTVANTKVQPGSNLSATVRVSGANSPTGSVSLGVVGESWSFNTATLLNGSAQFSYYLGSPGGYAMTAQYKGDSRNLPSTVQSPLIVVQTGVAGNLSVEAIVGPTRREISAPVTVQ
jgi:Pro-kumamolisin, activation domain/Bacterial Ig-like domain (group 3)